MDAATIYERFLHEEIDRISFMKIECDWCVIWADHHKMLDYDGKRFCCEECLEEYIDCREEKEEN